MGAYVAQANVLDERGVHVHALDGLLEYLDDDAVDGRVLEAALAALGQGRPDREGDDDIVGVLLGTVLVSRNVQSTWQNGHGLDARLLARGQDLRRKRSQSLGRHV